MRSVGLTALAFLGMLPAAQGATIYVDSRVGSDAFDGLAREPINEYTGPLKTLQRAMQLIDAGDTLELTDNGTPYYGSLSLVGARFSGTVGAPLRIVGNGATISGALPIAPDTWREEAPHLWRVTPRRKGHYQLVLDGAVVPEVDCPPGAGSLPELPEGHWCAYRGRIYYRSPVENDPRMQAFALADAEVGVTLLDVHHVEIHDVVIEHFRLDGINAHDRCNDILLIGVTCRGNGRSGLCVAGTAKVILRSGRLVDNREYSLLITELGQALVEESETVPAPTIAE